MVKQPKYKIKLVTTPGKLSQDDWKHIFGHVLVSPKTYQKVGFIREKSSGPSDHVGCGCDQVGVPAVSGDHCPAGVLTPTLSDDNTGHTVSAVPRVCGQGDGDTVTSFGQVCVPCVVA